MDIQQNLFPNQSVRIQTFQQLLGKRQLFQQAQMILLLKVMCLLRMIQEAPDKRKSPICLIKSAIYFSLVTPGSSSGVTKKGIYSSALSSCRNA